MLNSAKARGKDFQKDLKKPHKKSGKRARASKDRQLPESFYARLFAHEDDLSSRLYAAFLDKLQTIPERIWTPWEISACVDQETEEENTREVFE